MQTKVSVILFDFVVSHVWFSHQFGLNLKLCSSCLLIGEGVDNYSLFTETC